MGELEEGVVVGEVGETGHLFRQLVGDLVELLHLEVSLAVVEPQEVLVELGEEALVVGPLTRDASVALAASLVGEGDAAEEAIGEVFLVEGAGGVGGGAEGEVDTEDGVAGNALLGGAQGAGAALHVVDIADGLAHLAVTAAHAVGHLHLREVEVLRAAALFLERHSVLQEGGVGEVGRREPEGHIGTFRLLLVRAAGLHLALPVGQALVFGLVVGAERAHDSLNQVRQLGLSYARRADEMAHLATQFIEFVVGIEE